MAAPKGNKFWMLRSKHGRDKLFATPQLMWEAACEYFEWCEKNPFKKAEVIKSGDSVGKIIKVPVMRPFTLHGLCSYLDCDTAYFNHFESSLNKEDDEAKDFIQVISHIREAIYNQKFSGAASGFFNANIISRDLGLSDRTELSGKDGKPIETIINQPMPEIKVYLTGPEFPKSEDEIN